MDYGQVDVRMDVNVDVGCRADGLWMWMSDRWIVDVDGGFQ